MKYLHASIYWLLVVLLIFLLSGCNPIGDSVDEATSTAADLIDKAIAAVKIKLLFIQHRSVPSL